MNNDAYDEGMNAQLDGKEFWENPHNCFNSRYMDGMAWFAGWCWSKKMAAEDDLK